MNYLNITPIVLHKIIDSEEADNFEDIDLSVFKIILSEVGSQSITVKDLCEPGKLSLDRYCMITFDDGYSSDYDIAFPLLQDFGIKATFFINPVNIGSFGFMNWHMVREMSDAGMVIGSHGYNHLKMTKLKHGIAKKELVDSKNSIEDNIGKSVDLFSFPFGCYNKDIINLALEVGYKYCFTSDHGIIRSLKNVIPRNSINGSMSQDSIGGVLQPSSLTKVKWSIEDYSKKCIKNTLGDRYYRLFRDNFLRN